jgi:DNA-binding response OmpR family regulator
MPTRTNPKESPGAAVEDPASLVVLVAEDDEALGAFMAMVLTESGYWVLSTCNGREAVRVLQSRRIDLLITDLIMPEQEGIETILYVRKNYPGLKVIATSGGHPTNLRMARKLGAWATVQKPFSVDELLATVEFVCQPGVQSESVTLGAEVTPSSPELTELIPDSEPQHRGP